MRYKITFLPDKKAIEVQKNTSIFDAAIAAGIELNTSCGGEGSCGKCKVKILEENENHYVLACKTLVQKDLIIEVPEEARLFEHQVLLKNKKYLHKLNPLCRKVFLEIEPISIDDVSSDLSRLKSAITKKTGIEKIVIGLPLLKILPEKLRIENWAVTVTLVYDGVAYEIIDIQPGKKTSLYGLAIDVGTTTVVISLVDVNNGNTVDVAGNYNKQIKFGDDVVTRMIFALSLKDGAIKLQNEILATINDLIAGLLDKNNLDSDDIYTVFVSGNTVMSHMLFGLETKYIRLEPYAPSCTHYPIVKGKDLNININNNAFIYSFPSIASYVGGDIVSGLLVTGITKSDKLILFVDIGTNGEIVIGNKDWLMSCACSAGPAFEGGGVTHGIRAMQGAIEKIKLDKNNLEVKYYTIGGSKPIGICGSGLIDCISKMLEARIINRTGSFEDIQNERIRICENEKCFILVWAKDSGIEKDILITENDIKNIIRSKAAVFAGIQSLLKILDLDISSIDKVFIAGGFGNYLNISDAIKIGLFPEIPLEKFKFIGNSSLKGAEIATLSIDLWEESKEISKLMTYFELSNGNLFMDEFMKAMFLPHTDLSLFPTSALKNL